MVIVMLTLVGWGFMLGISALFGSLASDVVEIPSYDKRRNI